MCFFLIEIYNLEYTYIQFILYNPWGGADFFVCLLLLLLLRWIERREHVKPLLGFVESLEELSVRQDFTSSRVERGSVTPAPFGKLWQTDQQTWTEL